MLKTTTYVECTLDEIPDGVRFDVPGRNQGQMVEVAYGGFSRAEHDEGDPFMRVIDRTVPFAVKYYKRDDVGTSGKRS